MKSSGAVLANFESTDRLITDKEFKDFSIDFLELNLLIAPKDKVEPITDEADEESIFDFLFLDDRIIVVKKKKPKGSEETLDEIVENFEDHQSINPEHNLSYNFAETQGVDYERLFSYLGNSVKPNDFSGNSYFSYDAPTLVAEEDFFHPKFGDELIDEVIRAAKIKNTYGVDVYVNPIKKSHFDAWKSGNSGENKLRYDLIVV